MRLVATRAAYGLESPREDWWDRAACKGLDRIFLSESAGGLGYKHAAWSVHICRHHCPVLVQCRRQTQEFVPLVGVQAGLAWRRPPDTAGPQLTQPREVWCGPWCAHLRRTEKTDD